MTELQKDIKRRIKDVKEKVRVEMRISEHWEMELYMPMYISFFDGGVMHYLTSNAIPAYDLRKEYDTKCDRWTKDFYGWYIWVTRDNARIIWHELVKNGWKAWKPTKEELYGLTELEVKEEPYIDTTISIKSVECCISELNCAITTLKRITTEDTDLQSDIDAALSDAESALYEIESSEVEDKFMALESLVDSKNDILDSWKSRVVEMAR